MKVRLPLKLNELVCSPCNEKRRKEPSILGPDGIMAEMVVPGRDGKPRTVAIDVIRLTFEEGEDGQVRGHVKARIPCTGCKGEHQIDISDAYRAPELHLQGEARCAHGHKMKFQRRSSWDYVDEGEHGGVIEVAGLFSCAECHSHDEATLRFAAPDMTKAHENGSVDVDLSTAESAPVPKTD